MLLALFVMKYVAPATLFLFDLAAGSAVTEEKRTAKESRAKLKECILK